MHVDGSDPVAAGARVYVTPRSPGNAWLQSSIGRSVAVSDA
jgi:hypothetical protein